MKQDKVDRRVQKAEQRAAKAAQQVQVAAQKAEQAAQKQAERIEKKAAKQTQIAEKKAAKAAKKAELANRKAEEKRAKIAAKAASRLASDEEAEGEEDGEGGEAAPKKKSKKKLLLLLLPVLALVVGVGVFFFLRRGGGEEEAPPEPIAAPAQYALGGDWVVPALPVQSTVTVYGEEIVPEPAEPKKSEDGKDGEDGEDGEADGAEEEAEPDLGVEFTPMLYTYQDLTNARSLVSAYTALLTSEDAGFFTVDDTMTKADPPDFGGETPPANGAVLLARNAPETEGVEAKLVQTLTLEWSEGNCTVAVELSEGRVREPAPPPGSSSGQGVTQVVESLRDLPPSVLGLEGDSMDDYRIYTQDGMARVNGNPCLRMSVYKITEGGGNEIAGHYFLSTDGLHVYKLDVSTNNVVELDIQDALK